MNTITCVSLALASWSNADAAMDLHAAGAPPSLVAAVIVRQNNPAAAEAMFYNWLVDDDDPTPFPQLGDCEFGACYGEWEAGDLLGCVDCVMDECRGSGAEGNDILVCVHNGVMRCYADENPGPLVWDALCGDTGE